MPIDIKDYQDEIDNIARQFVDVLERAITATGNDPEALQANSQIILCAVATALDVEQVKRFQVKP